MNFCQGKIILLARAFLLLSLPGFLQTSDVPNEIKRDVTCEPKFTVVPNHTACLPGSTASKVSEEDKQFIVDQHNRYRANATPSASNMMKLRWDDELAMLAQKLVDNCILKHDLPENRDIPGRMTVGQNIAFGYSNWSEVLKGWHNTIRFFTYGNSSNNFLLTGYYTQIMWATTKLVGCGQNKCNGSEMYVCNYGPSGNDLAMINTPYKLGEAAANCPGHSVDTKLCDCNRTCLNEGDLDLKTCTCTCKDSNLYRLPDCDLICSAKPDGIRCSSSGKCPFHNIYCPHKCGLCPMAGKDFNGKDSQSRLLM